MIQDRLQYGFRLFENVIVPETQHLVTERFEEARSRKILLLAMLSSVDLED
jgi:hypothetical protein